MTTPAVRYSELTMNMEFTGQYYDVLDGRINDVHNWKVDGLRYASRSGIAEGKQNRFWYKRDWIIPYGDIVDIDVKDFSTVDAGKGTGQDNLGLPIHMDEVVFVYIKNHRFGGSLRMKTDIASGWTSLINGEVEIPHGSRFVAQTQSKPGWEVVGGAKYLRLRPGNNGGDCKIDVYIAGRDLS